MGNGNSSDSSTCELVYEFPPTRLSRLCRYVRNLWYATNRELSIDNMKVGARQLEAHLFFFHSSTRFRHLHRLQIQRTTCFKTYFQEIFSDLEHAFPSSPYHSSNYTHATNYGCAIGGCDSSIAVWTLREPEYLPYYLSGEKNQSY